ncbi:MAG: pyridoxal-phosphate dependent enzyme, partial [Thermoproteota archaeon]
GASLSGYAAKAGVDCTLFLSGKVDVGKLYQMIAYGANIEFAKDGKATVSDRTVGKETLQVKTNSPFFLDGLKTTGYEVCEELGWVAPDKMIVPMGNGAHISMIWRGMKELREAGFLEGLGTGMCGVQVSGCAPIVKAFLEKKGEVEALERAETDIVDIAVKSPTEGFMALKTLYESKGSAVAVSYQEVLDAAKALAREEGIFAEPAGASTIAGLKKLVEDGRVGKDEEVVCVITGMGLKDPRSARSFIERSRGVEKFLRAMEEGGFTTKLGETKLRVLRILSRKELYGYEIRKSLRDSYRVRISVPSVYQHLSELERSGLVQRTRSQSVSGKPERHYYAITARGKAVLAQAEKMERTGIGSSWGRTLAVE